MRQALRAKAPRAQVVDVYSIPSPIGGWNAKDALAAMPEIDAFKLINWYPTATECSLRGGYSQYTTSGISDTVETLAVYNEMDGGSSMFAVSDTDVYDVSSPGAATDSSLVGNPTITDGKFQTINFGDGTANYLIMVNGVDAPIYWNGTAWVTITGVSSPLLSGVTLTSLIHVNEYHGRLFFLEKDSLSFWYLPAGAAGGALREFDLAAYAGLGGYLMWAATWSFDAGDGPDDVLVFMTSKGQVIVYRGTDPSTAANWDLIGVYFLGEPLGRRSYVNYGGDLVAITQNGVFPIAKALQTATIDNTSAITDKIEGAFSAASRTYGDNFGWEGTLFPAQSALIFNVPVVVGGTKRQFIMNTITNAWCEFDSWNGECFAVYKKDLYFAGALGTVQKAWTGTSDDGAEITAIGKTAFNYFGNTSQQKRFNFFRPLLQISGSLIFNAGMDVDFTDNEITGTSEYSADSGDVWDTAIWDTATWSGTSGTGTSGIVRQWTSPSNNVGYAASGGIKVNVMGITIHWQASDFVYERGGIL